MSEFENSKVVSYVVFFCTLLVVSLTIISLVFPALLSSYFGKFGENLDPFESNNQSIYFIVSNVVIFGFGIAYYKKKIPSSVHDLLEKIRTFEISKKVSIISLAIILVVYIGLSIPELSIDESTQWGDYGIIVEGLEIWPFGQSDDVVIQEQNDRYVRMFLLDISLDIFQNIKILPFIASILVVVFTYLITVQFCQKRFAGIIAVIVLLQCYTFLKFDTIAVYENFWILFFLISLYVIQKKWFLSPVFYILAFFTKAYVAPFFLLTLFTTYRSQVSRRTKIAILISYIVAITLTVLLVSLANTMYPQLIDINYSKLMLGFQTIAAQLRFDFFFIMALLPETVGLMLLSKNKLKHADSILILIFGTILVGVAVGMFTAYVNILMYRFIPLLVFFSIGMGMFFSKKLVHNS